MARRITTAAIAALALGALVGCSNAEPGGDVDQESPTNPFEIDMVLAVESSPFYQSMKCGADAAADAHGAVIRFSAPQNWGATDQQPVIDAVANNRADALIVVPTDPEALTPSLKRIKEQGTVIVEVDQKLADDQVSVSRIGSDDFAGGAQAARTLAELIGSEGKVMTITAAPGVDQQYTRAQGFAEELEAQFPNVVDLGQKLSDSDVNLAAAHVTAQLASDPDLAGIFVTNDLNALGVIAGLRQAGKIGDVTVVAYDAADTQIEALENGELAALVAQNPYAQGEAAVTTALDALSGKPVEKVQLMDFAVLTADDPEQIEQYLIRNSGGDACVG